MPRSNLVVDEPLGDAILAEAIARAKARKAATKENFDKSLGDTFEEYEQEIARIRKSLKRFCEYVFGYKLEAHHLLIVQLIEDLVNGKLPYRKLCLVAPPNSAKSTYASIATPLWYLGNNPDQSLLFFTSSDPNATAFSNTLKGVWEDHEKYHAVFPSPDLKPNPKRGWSTDGLYLRGANPLEKDPSYRAVGMKASIMGGRAHGAIVDDPLSYRDAQSDIEQETVKGNLDTTINTRLHRPSDGSEFEGWLISIGTRWKEQDWLEHQKKRNDVLFINIPVRAQPYVIDNPNSVPDPLGRAEGERLWPIRYSEEFLKAEEEALGTAVFNCVYNGDPTSMGGEVFESESWFQDLPADFYVGDANNKSMFEKLHRIQAYDTAFSERDTACYTVGGTACVDRDLNIYLIDIRRERMSTRAFENAVVEDAQKFNPFAVALEEAAFRHSVVKKSVRNIRKRCRYNVYSVPQTVDKVARARLPASHAQAGKLYVDKKAPWYPAFARECLGFPRSAFKDQVDMLSLMAEMLEHFEQRKDETVKKVRIVPSRTRTYRKDTRIRGRRRVA